MIFQLLENATQTENNNEKLEQTPSIRVILSFENASFWNLELYREPLLRLSSRYIFYKIATRNFIKNTRLAKSPDFEVATPPPADGLNRIFRVALKINV